MKEKTGVQKLKEALGFLQEALKDPEERSSRDVFKEILDQDVYESVFGSINKKPHDSVHH